MGTKNEEFYADSKYAYEIEKKHDKKVIIQKLLFM